MNKYIQKLIIEQFNIGNMDLNNKSKRNMNIFNKNMICLELYNKFMDDSYNITDGDIKTLNSYVSEAPLKDLGDFINIVKVYSNKYRRDSLNWLDVSGITDMSLFFYCGNKYTGDISKWDVSNVKKMACMFTDTEFNGDIGTWDVSNVEDMGGMFINTSFNQDISGWDVSNVTNMKSMFSRSYFNRDISQWDVSNVEDMTSMFFSSVFNKDISNWDVSNVVNFKDIFDKCNIREEYKPAKFR